MERRKFLIGMGGTAVGASALIGSGAFTFVEADRDVEISVADDAEAFLSIEAENEEWAGDDDGVFYIDITSTDEDGEGLNREATTFISGIFSITNRGTQDVYVWFEGAGGEELPEGFGIGTDSNPDGDDTTLTLGDQSGDPVDHPEPEKLVLEPGQSHEEGWVWFTRDFDYDDFDDNGTIELTLKAATEERAGERAQVEN